MIRAPSSRPGRQASTTSEGCPSMITKHITACRTTFNPFRASAKPCRVFLAQFGPNAHRTVKFETKVLPQGSGEPATLAIKFSDGKDMSFDPETLKVADIMAEVDRHSRQLNRKAELAG